MVVSNVCRSDDQVTLTSRHRRNWSVSISYENFVDGWKLLRMWSTSDTLVAISIRTKVSSTYLCHSHTHTHTSLSIYWITLFPYEPWRHQQLPEEQEQPWLHHRVEHTFCCRRGSASQMWTFRVAFLGLFSSCSCCISLLSKFCHMMLSKRDTFDREWSQWWMSSDVLLSSRKFNKKHHRRSSGIATCAWRIQNIPSSPILNLEFHAQTQTAGNYQRGLF
jgi:hypothetical protein